MNKFPYQIINIRTNPRKPGIIYAEIVDNENRPYVSATLEYCIQWIENKYKELFHTSEEHPGFGPEADPERDYEGENRFGPN